MAEEVSTVRLKPETLQAFRDYIRDAEAAMDRTLCEGLYLWSDADPKRARHVRKGKIAADYWEGSSPRRVPSGLIHDWIAAAWVAGTTLRATLALIQDYDHHQNVYQPEVIGSRLISRHGDDFKIYLRVLKKKIITVVLDTDHEVHYFTLDGQRAGCRSATTRTAEVDNAGKPNEVVHPADSGYGFLWRLNSYWRFAELDGGVLMECRAISLTRDIPAALRWILDPMVRSLPKEALVHTLECTRRALLSPPVPGT